MSAAGAAVLVHVTGRVQGVGFRYWTLEEAVRLGIKGWVRNEPDGSVRALIVGSDEAVAAMLDAFRRGPPGAEVGNIEAAPADLPSRPVNFKITH